MVDTISYIFAQSSFVNKFLYTLALLSGLAVGVWIQRVAYVWTQEHFDRVIQCVRDAEAHNSAMADAAHKRTLEAMRADHELAVHYPDANGYVPLPREVVEHSDWARFAMMYNAQHSHNRKTHQRINVRYNNTAGGDEPAQLTDSGEHSAPTVAHLLSQRIIQPGVVYLGTDVSTGEHKTMDVSDIRGLGVLGWSGSGKSNLVRLLVAQAVASGAHLLAIDPHRHNQESIALSLGPLQSALQLQPAAEDDEIGDICEYMLEQMGERSQLRSCEHLPYLLLIIDELNNVLGREDIGGAVAEMVKTVAREGRKWRIGCICIAQTYSAQETGSAGMRKSLTNRIALRCDVDDASMFIQRGPLVNGIDDMPVGHAIIKGLTLGRPAHISMPLCGVEEVKQIARFQSSSSATSSTTNPLQEHYQSTTEATTEDLYGSADSSESVVPEKRSSSGNSSGENIPSAREQRIYQAMQNDVGINAIIRDVLGVDAKGGARWKDARKEIRQAATRFGMEDSKYGK